MPHSIVKHILFNGQMSIPIEATQKNIFKAVVGKIW